MFSHFTEPWNRFTTARLLGFQAAANGVLSPQPAALAALSTKSATVEAPCLVMLLKLQILVQLGDLVGVEVLILQWQESKHSDGIRLASKCL